MSVISLLGRLLLLSLLALVACQQLSPPDRSFSQEAAPTTPDYAHSDAWASLPFKPDPADYTPTGATPENQAQAEVDVFFIHPTTYRSEAQWNAAPNDTALNLHTDELPIKHQASIFNHSARVYAPRYRQMTYPGFFTKDQSTKQEALNLAYQDVKKAFQYYLDHFREGRPFIIATHSQGTIHGIRLVREYIDGQALQKEMVAAYLVGWPFPADTFAHLPVCQEPGQTGCVIGWCSWQVGELAYNHDKFYAGSVVVNPISWRADTLLAPKSQHEGLVGRKYRRIRPGKVDAQAHDGVLWVSKPYPIMPDKNYHIGDYNIFWADVRSNVATRVAAYLSAQQADKQAP
jgi:hypothetical protein